MNRGTVAALTLAGVAVGGGCGGVSEKTYAYTPTRACLERLDHVGAFPVTVAEGNYTMLGAGARGPQFMVSFGDRPDGPAVANLVYVIVLHNTADAKQALSDYQEHVAAGEMGYSGDLDISRKGNVAFAWMKPPDSEFKDAFEGCLR
jgi:hypothetical protein